MVFACSWAFRLNLAVMLTASMAINNVWTLVPIYLSDYIFGYWLSHTVFKFNFSWLDTLLIRCISFIPIFMMKWFNWAFDKINYFFEHTLGLAKPCFWSFLIGGNLLGLMTSLILYPIIKRLFTKLSHEIHGAH